MGKSQPYQEAEGLDEYDERSYNLFFMLPLYFVGAIVWTTIGVAGTFVIVGEKFREYRKYINRPNNIIELSSQIRIINNTYDEIQEREPYNVIDITRHLKDNFK
jgi:hypothetical protein